MERMGVKGVIRRMVPLGVPRVLALLLAVETKLLDASAGWVAADATIAAAAVTDVAVVDWGVVVETDRAAGGLDGVLVAAVTTGVNCGRSGDGLAQGVELSDEATSDGACDRNGDAMADSGISGDRKVEVDDAGELLKGARPRLPSRDAGPRSCVHTGEAEGEDSSDDAEAGGDEAESKSESAWGCLD